MRLAAWNAGNAYLENKINEIEAVIESVKPHLLVVSEANLRHSTDQESVKIQGYDMLEAKTISNTEIRSIIRVVSYKHESVTGKLRPDLMNNTVDSVWIELGFKYQKKLLLGGLYRVWQHMGQGPNKESLSAAAQLGRWQSFLSQWETALQEDKETVVLGDLNIDWLCCNSESSPSDPRQAAKWRAARPLMDELDRRITPHGVVQMVRGITRNARGHSDSALDLVFTTTPEKMSEARALVRAYSDHRLVLCTRFTKNIVTSPRYVKKRSYKNFDETMFKERIRNTSMMNVYMSGDASKAAELLTSNINSVLNKMAPVKKIQVRQNYAPWVSEGCKRDIDTRERAQEKAVASQQGEDWDEFRRIRNAVTRRVRKEKEDWMKTKIDRCEANSSTCWKNIMGWLGWATTGSPTRLYSGFRVETSPNKMANIMNEFYIQKVANIRAALPPPSVNPLSMLSSMLADCNTPEFTLQPVHPATVNKIITNLSNSKASGLDYIDTYIIKLVKNEILPSITHIINTSIECGVFPEIYKRSRIIPLLKDPKFDKMAPGSYRL